ncbi:hypothetical protein NKH59_31455 [Mesorhizobium sp. M0998]
MTGLHVCQAVGSTFSLIRPGDAIDRDCQDNDRKASFPNLEARDRSDDLIAQATGAYHGRDDDHPQRHHHALIDARHNRPECQRQFD